MTTLHPITQNPNERLVYTISEAGDLLGIFIGPLVLSRMLRASLNSPSGKHRKSTGVDWSLT